ncbi:unnamed protein product [Dicrocoelium dendriticum]|nr:unnamed protein product [Dicrocoelium dendriticum]
MIFVVGGGEGHRDYSSCCMSSYPMNWFRIISFGKSACVVLSGCRRSFHLSMGSAAQAKKPSVTISDYLLDRTIPAEEVLRKLTDADHDRLKVIQAEHQLMADQGRRVPSHLDADDLLELLCCATFASRMRYYEFAFKREMTRLNEKAKKANRPPREYPSDTSPKSGDRILRVVDAQFVRAHRESWMWAEIRCQESSQKLVFDFSHESEMRLVDQKNLALQMVYSLNAVRCMKPHPFHMVCCGLLPGTNQFSFLEKQFSVGFPGSSLKSLYDIPWTISPNHYSVDFPVDNPSQPVFYLSPNASRSFEPGEWDHNAVYVVGALVDKAVHRPYTFAKARRLDFVKSQPHVSPFARAQSQQ